MLLDITRKEKVEDKEKRVCYLWNSLWKKDFGGEAGGSSSGLRAFSGASRGLL